MPKELLRYSITKINMKKKFKEIIIVLLCAICVLLLFYNFRLTQELHNYQNPDKLHGSFITDDKAMMDAQYLVINHENDAYWYQQNGFYKEGNVERTDSDNVYKIIFDDQSVTLVYYQQSLIFIEDTHVSTFTRTSNGLEFIGIEAPNNLND